MTAPYNTKFTLEECLGFFYMPVTLRFAHSAVSIFIYLFIYIYFYSTVPYSTLRSLLSLFFMVAGGGYLLSNIATDIARWEV